jgi:hypothetical protein
MQKRGAIKGKEGEIGSHHERGGGHGIEIRQVVERVAYGMEVDENTSLRVVIEKDISSTGWRLPCVLFLSSAVIFKGKYISGLVLYLD